MPDLRPSSTAGPARGSRAEPRKRGPARATGAGRDRAGDARHPQGRAARRALGAVLRQLREADSRRPSQERLGEWADLHRNYVGSAERGERNVAFEALTRWLGALGVSWAQFGAAVDRALGDAAPDRPAPAGGGR